MVVYWYTTATVLFSATNSEPRTDSGLALPSQICHNQL